MKKLKKVKEETIEEKEKNTPVMEVKEVELEEYTDEV